MKSLFAVLAATLFVATTHAAEPADPARFASCLSELKGGAAGRGVSGPSYERLTASLVPDMKVLDFLDYQPEFRTPIWDYLSGLVDEERVADGKALHKQWAEVLAAASARYKVDPATVVAVWGVESNFGRNFGQRPLLTSLSTLSCYGRRQAYFRGEFYDALKIVDSGDVKAEQLVGSWAGAFGHTQFMPSTFLRLAVDFDGDGRRDLVGSIPDALASTANFLHKAGWREGETWGYEVQLPAGFDASQAGRRNKQAVASWSARGVTTPSGATWRAIDIVKLLRNPRMAGIVVYKGTVYPEAKAQWKPIVSMRTWEEFQRIKSGRKQSGAPSAGKPKHLLSGFLVCGKCGDRLYATWALRKKRKDGTRAPSYRIYNCTRNRCVSIGADQVDLLVTEHVLERIDDPRVVASMSTLPDTKPIEEELAGVRTRRKGVVDLVADGTLRSDEARPRLNDLGKEIERLEASLARMRADSPLADLAAADAVRERWSKLDVVRRRQILEALELRITVDPVDRVADGSRWTWVLDEDGKRTIDPSRLRYASVVD